VNSTFTNLNYGQVLYTLGSLNRKLNLNSNSRGIICSINDFEGDIEFKGNNISKNMVFIPSAIFTNNQKYNKSVTNFELNDFLNLEI